jgi:hypothetical protein
MKRGVKIGLWIVTIIAVIVVLIGIGGYIYLRISSPHLVRRARGVDERIVRVNLEELHDARFVQGMQSGENLYLDPTSMQAYVTDLNGYVYLLNGHSWNDLEIVKSLKIGTFALGIDKGPDGWLYVGVSEHDMLGWIEQGGAIFKLDMALEQPVKLTESYPALNGVAFDGEGRCYFATVSEYDFLHPNGEVYIMEVAPDGTHSEPQKLLSNVGLANGIHYNKQLNKLYLSNTIERVVAFNPCQTAIDEIYLKTKYLEAIDDLCTDSQGNLWMTDPFDSFVKMYDPQTKHLIRYVIDGVGQTSSCGIRNENGEDILYVTEIKTKREPLSETYDGRGVVILPLQSLVQLSL